MSTFAPSKPVENSLQGHSRGPETAFVHPRGEDRSVDSSRFSRSLRIFPGCGYPVPVDTPNAASGQGQTELELARFR